MTSAQHDLTSGPIPQLLIKMAIPIGIGLLLQTLYFVVDLYFVSSLGDAAVAGVGIAGNLNFLIIALTQIFNVGVTALISQAVGRKATGEAQSDFNQALLLCGVFAFITLLLGYGFADAYINTLSDDPATVENAHIYLWWFLPNMALQFAMTVMIAGLRGIGVVKPTMMVQLVSVLINIVLAPVLISGWLTGHAFGVLGAGLASSIAAGVGFLMLASYFKRSSSFLKIDLYRLKPMLSTWQRIVAIGLPTGGEFVLMFSYMAIVYWALQDFGAHAQAGFGIGQRVMQSMLMPGLALSFAAPAIVGQNFGAGQAQRVRDIQATLLEMNVIVLGSLGVLCIIFGEHMMRFFTHEAPVIATGAEYLFWTGFAFMPSVVILSCNGIYQGLGNTWPALFSSLCRISIIILGVYGLMQSAEFESVHLWQLSLLANAIQATISYLLLRRLMSQKLAVIPAG